MATDDHEWAGLLEMSRVHHIKHEFDGCSYRLAIEIIRLREKLGEPVCPHYAPAWAPSADTTDDLPF